MISGEVGFIAQRPRLALSQSEFWQKRRQVEAQFACPDLSGAHLEAELTTEGTPLLTVFGTTELTVWRLRPFLSRAPGALAAALRAFAKAAEPWCPLLTPALAFDHKLHFLWSEALWPQAQRLRPLAEPCPQPCQGRAPGQLRRLAEITEALEALRVLPVESKATLSVKSWCGEVSTCHHALTLPGDRFMPHLQRQLYDLNCQDGGHCPAS
ncbi:hypothetical protein [Deinococcus multiflagellatus]|uniref:Uncharacterized protein n=1 Tax=Deinococcus multiflagellatus TaxID=1656887 RepID=A0ABW1ZTV5_9DEIO